MVHHRQHHTLHSHFHNILADATRNPIIQITMEAVMEVMRKFIERIGPSDNTYTIPSRKRLLKHLRSRDADAAVAEMEKFLHRLQSNYLALWNSR